MERARDDHRDNQQSIEEEKLADAVLPRANAAEAVIQTEPKDARLGKDILPEVANNLPENRRQVAAAK